MLVTSIFSFSHNVFYSITDRNDHLCYIFFFFFLLSANAFNLDQVNFLSSGNGLRLGVSTIFCPLETMF